MFISYKDMSVFALHFAVGYVLSRYSFFIYSFNSYYAKN